MSSKPETTFIASVHKHLPPKFYHMKTHNPYISGPADVWYSGTLDDLWVEYKFIVLPKRADTMILPELSKIQSEWLNDRSREGRNIAVIVGCKEGGVVYTDRSWDFPMPKSGFADMLMSRVQLASWILEQTGGPL